MERFWSRGAWPQSHGLLEGRSDAVRSSAEAKTGPPARFLGRRGGLPVARRLPLIFFSFHILQPFLFGSAIYLLWRSKTILLFSWLRFVGLYAPVAALRAQCAGVKHLIPGVILYSVPDGLWLYSFTALMGLIWFNEPRRSIRAFWIVLPVLLAVGSEFAQRFRLIPGTFDWWDVVSYIAAWVPAVVSIHVFLSRTAERTPLRQ